MSAILLGVCGGIAAYKAAALTSRLVQDGHAVHVILTDEAQRFVAPLTFSALTRRHVYTSLWDAPERIPHIALVREADVLAIVPATANALAKMALGIADDLLSNAALAARIPIVVAPAMNSAMYEHPATQAHLRTLRDRGVTVVEPGSGFLAERERGIGRLADEPDLLAAIYGACEHARELGGRRVLITAGPTREPIDPVRFISNASSGTTGIELAREALRRGAQVDLVLGPTTAAPPAGAHVVRVETAQEMFDATAALAEGADVAIATAAVCDWRPATPSDQKVKKSAGPATLDLVRTPDILAMLGERFAAGGKQRLLVGFAAETQDAETYGRAKLAAKRLDAIAVNDVTGGRGFGDVENELVLLHGENGRIALGHANKATLAKRLWDALLTLEPAAR